MHTMCTLSFIGTQLIRSTPRILTRFMSVETVVILNHLEILYRERNEQIQFTILPW